MLESLGYGPFFEETFRALGDPELAPARVALTGRGRYRVLGRDGERLAALAGRLRADEDAVPVTGDWVAIRDLGGEDAVIEALLPRRTLLARRAPGDGRARQPLAANADLALLVQPCDRPNVRSLERYAALAAGGGVPAVAVLSKGDLPEAAAAARGMARAGLEVLAVSARSGEGLAALGALLRPRATAVLLGPSGAGKSTLANALAGSVLLPTGDVRASDGRGRHTTTARQLVPLPGGAWLLDTPGLRELALDGPAPLFDDVEALAPSCRFRDCRHDREPGCAVRAAAEQGVLDPGRLAGWRKLRREADWLAEREASTPAAAEKSRWKWLTREMRRRSR